MTDNSGGGSAALIHLSCFGGFRVTAERPLGAPFLQPGGVAVLAILAAVGDEGISGEELRRLAWGDLPEEEGRAALATALAALWRGGNGDSLLATGDRIAFHADRVTTDVARFAAACARGDVAAATEIYEGPYFGGVALDAGAAFNEWLEATRTRFNTVYQELAREARRAARRPADSTIPDWTAPIELVSLPESEPDAAPQPEVTTPAVIPVSAAEHAAPDEAVAELVPPAPRGRLYLWLGGAVLACAALALLMNGRSSDGGNGAAALARGDFAVARAALDRAIAKDSVDGWLWFQLARAADGLGDDATADRAAVRADSLREALPSDRGTLVHAFGQWRSGNTLSAIALLDSLVQQQPEFVEATAVLGEVRYRSAPLIGQSRASARPALQRTVALNPSAGASWRRLLAIALLDHDTAQADNSLAGLRNAAGPSADTTDGWLRALWTTDSTAMQQALARAASAKPADLLEQARLLGFDAGRTTEALALTAPLLDQRNSRADRISARVLRAALFGAVDDWTRADSEAVALGREWPWGGLMLESAALLAPSRSVRPAALRGVRDRLMRLAPDTSAARHLFVPVASRTVRLYLLGELSYRLNDARGLQAAVDSLSSPKLGELGLPRTGGSYALALQALQFLARGDSASALGRLERASGAVPARDQQQLWINGSLERRRRALLLDAMGRPGEAAGWKAASGEFVVDLLFGPSPR